MSDRPVPAQLPGKGTAEETSLEEWSPSFTGLTHFQ
jgi:hypothetical protein